MCVWLSGTPRPTNYDGCEPVTMSATTAGPSVALSFAAVQALVAACVGVGVLVVRADGFRPLAGIAAVLVSSAALAWVVKHAARTFTTPQAATATTDVSADRLGALLITVAGSSGYVLSDDRVTELLGHAPRSLSAGRGDEWSIVADILNAEAVRLGVAPTATPSAVAALAAGVS